MHLRRYRSFSTELIKIAVEIMDPDIRALAAARKGQEYLAGGQLPDNGPADQPVLRKMAEYYSTPDTYAVRGKKPTGQNSAYETASNIASSGLKGGMTGAGAYALQHNLRHGFDVGAKTMHAGHLGKAVTIGAGLAVGDRLLRHRAAAKRLRAEAANSEMMKQAMNSATFTPAREAQRTSTVGHFQNKIHMPQPKSTAVGPIKGSLP